MRRRFVIAPSDFARRTKIENSIWWPLRGVRRYTGAIVCSNINSLHQQVQKGDSCDRTVATENDDEQIRAGQDRRALQGVRHDLRRHPGEAGRHPYTGGRVRRLSAIVYRYVTSRSGAICVEAKRAVFVLVANSLHQQQVREARPRFHPNRRWLGQ